MIPDQYANLFSSFDYRVPLPTYAFSEFNVLGTDRSGEVLFTWEPQKIMVFDDKNKINVEDWKSFYCEEINVNDFMAMF